MSDDIIPGAGDLEGDEEEELDENGMPKLDTDAEGDYKEEAYKKEDEDDDM